MGQNMSKLGWILIRWTILGLCKEWTQWGWHCEKHGRSCGKRCLWKACLRCVGLQGSLTSNISPDVIAKIYKHDVDFDADNDDNDNQISHRKAIPLWHSLDKSHWTPSKCSWLFQLFWFSIISCSLSKLVAKPQQFPRWNHPKTTRITKKPTAQQGLWGDVFFHYTSEVAFGNITHPSNLASHFGDKDTKMIWWNWRGSSSRNRFCEICGKKKHCTKMASSFEPIPDDFWRFDGTPRDGRINPIYDMGIFRDILKKDMHHSLPYIENLHTYHKWLVYIYI